MPVKLEQTSAVNHTLQTPQSLYSTGKVLTYLPPLSFQSHHSVLPILPHHTQRHTVQQLQATFSSLNRGRSVPLHLNIFGHSVSLASNVLFPLGLVTCLFNLPFKWHFFHWSHPDVGCSFLCPDGTCFLLPQQEGPYPVLYWIWNQTSLDISNTKPWDLYMTGFWYMRKERQGKPEKERERDWEGNVWTVFT